MTETYWVASFKNTAAAIAAEKAVLSSGTSARLIALPPEISAGCGFALKIPSADREAAQSILDADFAGDFDMHLVEQTGLSRRVITADGGRSNE